MEQEFVSASWCDIGEAGLSFPSRGRMLCPVTTLLGTGWPEIVSLQALGLCVSSAP